MGRLAREPPRESLQVTSWPDSLPCPVLSRVALPISICPPNSTAASTSRGVPAPQQLSPISAPGMLPPCYSPDETVLPQNLCVQHALCLELPPLDVHKSHFLTSFSVTLIMLFKAAQMASHTLSPIPTLFFFIVCITIGYTCFTSLFLISPSWL